MHRVILNEYTYEKFVELIFITWIQIISEPREEKNKKGCTK